MSFLMAMCVVFFVYTFAHFFCLIPIRIVLCYSFFAQFLQKKYFFCFLSYSPQRQMNSFRISGVHGTLLSQIIPLQYITFSLGCQVKIMLILFYYFAQHFITIFFAQHLTTIFLHVLCDIYKGRNSLRKYILDVQNPYPIRRFAVIFLAHFHTQNINLPNYIIPYILLLVKLRLC